MIQEKTKQKDSTTSQGGIQSNLAKPPDTKVGEIQKKKDTYHQIKTK